jgi:acetoacetate decarboxylase
MTRTFPVGKATPRVEAGARFGATCAANDRQIVRAVVTLREISSQGSKVTNPPMYNTRHYPAYDGTLPDVFELVRSGGFDRSATEVWEGDADLKIYDDTIENMQAIKPVEVLKGYRFSFGYTVHGGTVVAQHDKELARP